MPDTEYIVPETRPKKKALPKLLISHEPQGRGSCVLGRGHIIVSMKKWIMISKKFNDPKVGDPKIYKYI